jgi:hypothetical protein
MLGQREFGPARFATGILFLTIEQMLRRISKSLADKLRTLGGKRAGRIRRRGYVDRRR